MSQTGSVMGVWRKSIRCESQQCVEVAQVGTRMAVRNSTEPGRLVIFGAEAWQSFMITLRNGEWHNG
jgi:hypothetical protein